MSPENLRAARAANEQLLDPKTGLIHNGHFDSGPSMDTTACMERCAHLLLEQAARLL